MRPPSVAPRPLKSAGRQESGVRSQDAWARKGEEEIIIFKKKKHGNYSISIGGEIPTSDSPVVAEPCLLKVDRRRRAKAAR